MKHSLLIVDDEKDNLDALERIFRKNFKVYKALSGKEALDILSHQSVTVIISDQRMPQMTGVEFLGHSLKTSPNSIRILLTGYTDVESVISAINTGQIYRYVTKPWDPHDLELAVNRAVERFELNSELKLKNVQLETALNELRSLDQTKNQFMMLINHELKTPLTSIINFLSLLKETTLTNDQNKYINRIEKSTNKLHEIILDVLDFVSAETGQTKIDKKHQSISEILQTIENKVKTEVHEKNQKLVFECSETSAFFDKTAIENVLYRVIHNASKFGDQNTDILIKTSATANKKMLINITNIGRPIDESVIEKIKKPFSLDENIMNHTKGIGLGLSISRALLQLHNSTLNITSDKNKVTVTFEL